jgi:predicted nucleic acid-binding protein
MLKPQAFWDASSLVPLCAIQSSTQMALQMERKYRYVVWWATHVEVTSALNRMRRQHEISEATYTQAKLQAEGIKDLWAVVMPSLRIEHDARLLLERYPLGAADALQLAAALSWCEHKPKSKVFLTFDKRLKEAAEATGFNLE